MSPRPPLTPMFLRVLIGIGLWVCTPVAADDVDPLDRQLLESLEGTPPADSPTRIIPRLIETTKATARRLKEGHVDQETTSLQEQILADIDALLKQSSPPNQQPPSATSQRAPQGQNSSSPPNQQEASSRDSQNPSGGQNDPSVSSKESQERTTPGNQGTVASDSRLGLSTAAWGHLPPKVREQMRSAFSEEYLPEYDALVRGYFEALARRGSAQRDRVDKE